MYPKRPNLTLCTDLVAAVRNSEIPGASNAQAPFFAILAPNHARCETGILGANPELPGFVVTLPQKLTMLCGVCAC